MASDLNSDCNSPQSKTAGKRKQTEVKRRKETNAYFEELMSEISLIEGFSGNVQRKLDKLSILREARSLVRLYNNYLDQVADKGSQSKESGRARCLSAGAPLWSEYILDAMDACLFLLVPPGKVLHASDTVLSVLGNPSSTYVGKEMQQFINHKEHNAFYSSVLLPLCQQFDSALLRPEPSHRKYSTFNIEAAWMSAEGNPVYISTKSKFLLRKWDLDDLAQGSPDISMTVKPPTTFDVGQSGALVGVNCSLKTMEVATLESEEEYSYSCRISKEGIFLEVKKHVTAVLGYTERELVGMSIFEFIDPYHLDAFGSSMETFLKKGVGTTEYYRFITKGNRWVWCRTKGYITCNPWNNEIDHIFLNTQIIGTDQVPLKDRFKIHDDFLPDRSPKNLFVEKSVRCKEVSNGGSNLTTSSTSMDTKLAAMEKMLKEMEQRLEKKNSELYSLQKSYLEQQNLQNQERKSFMEMANMLIHLKPPKPAQAPSSNHIGSLMPQMMGMDYNKGNHLASHSSLTTAVSSTMETPNSIDVPSLNFFNGDISALLNGQDDPQFPVTSQPSLFGDLPLSPD